MAAAPPPAPPPPGAATGQVFFATLTRNGDSSSNREEKRRAHLEFQFTQALTADDLIENVSVHVKQKGGRTATSRRSSGVFVYNTGTKGIEGPLDRQSRLMGHPAVQRSIVERGSVALLIDDVRDGRGSFRVGHASPDVLRRAVAEHSPTASPRGAADRSASRDLPQHSPSPAPAATSSTTATAATTTHIDPAPQETAAAMLEAEMTALRAAQQEAGYARWPSLVPRNPPTHKRWQKALDREREAMGAHRAALVRAASAAAAATASISAECDRIEADTREMNAACLAKAPEFDRRHVLTTRLKELRDTVKKQSDTERELMAAIEAQYARNAAVAAGGATYAAPASLLSSSGSPRDTSSPPRNDELHQPQPQRHMSSSAATTTTTGSPPGNEAGGGSSAVWPSFNKNSDKNAGATAYDAAAVERALSPEAQAEQVAALWGCRPEDLLPLETAAAQARAATTSPPGGSGGGGSPPGAPSSSSAAAATQYHTTAVSTTTTTAAAVPFNDNSLRASPIRGADPAASPPAAVVGGGGSHQGGGTSLEAGLAMLPSDLTSRVREVLHDDSAGSTRSRSPAAATTAGGTVLPLSSAALDGLAGGGSGGEGGVPMASQLLDGSVKMRVLASDLGMYLATDGSDAETRRELLLRVQALRGQLAERRSNSSSGSHGAI